MLNVWFHWNKHLYSLLSFSVHLYSLPIPCPEPVWIILWQIGKIKRWHVFSSNTYRNCTERWTEISSIVNYVTWLHCIQTVMVYSLYIGCYGHLRCEREGWPWSVSELTRSAEGRGWRMQQPCPETARTPCFQSRLQSQFPRTTEILILRIIATTCFIKIYI